jgi:glycolate oxidase iron-sulfur subunit
LSCVHCGLCLAACPTYLETGNENRSPRGRVYLMRQLQSGRAALDAVAVAPIDSCLGCLACQPACPAGVHYGELLETTRDFIERRFTRPWFERVLRRWVIEGVFPFPWRMRLALLPLKLIRALGLERFLPKFARDAAALVPSDVRMVDLPEISPGEGPLKGRVGIITGCVQSVLFSQTNAATLRLLNRAGYDVIAPMEQGCCGALYSHSGRLEKARECARHNIATFERHRLDYIVINASGCGSTLKNYGQLLKDDPAWAKRAEAFAAKVRDFVEVMVISKSEIRVLNSEVGVRTSDFGLRTSLVTYHDACHLANAQGIRQQPRDLLRAVCGANFVELPETELCCGSAGTYNLTQPAMAARLQERKTGNILKTGAKIVVTTNPGCLLQIRAGLSKAGRADIEALHMADFLERKLSPSDCPVAPGRKPNLCLTPPAAGS